jgi:hypothetical protein
MCPICPSAVVHRSGDPRGRSVTGRDVPPEQRAGPQLPDRGDEHARAVGQGDGVPVPQPKSRSPTGSPTASPSCTAVGSSLLSRRRRIAVGPKRTVIAAGSRPQVAHEDPRVWGISHMCDLCEESRTGLRTIHSWKDDHEPTKASRTPRGCADRSGGDRTVAGRCRTRGRRWRPPRRRLELADRCRRPEQPTATVVHAVR